MPRGKPAPKRPAVPASVERPLAQGKRTNTSRSTANLILALKDNIYAV